MKHKTELHTFLRDQVDDYEIKYYIVQFVINYTRSKVNEVNVTEIKSKLLRYLIPQRIKLFLKYMNVNPI